MEELAATREQLKDKMELVGLVLIELRSARSKRAQENEWLSETNEWLSETIEQLVTAKEQLASMTEQMLTVTERLTATEEALNHITNGNIHLAHQIQQLQGALVEQHDNESVF